MSKKPQLRTQKVKWKPSQYKLFAASDELMVDLLGMVEENEFGTWDIFYSDHRGVLVELEEEYDTRTKAGQALLDYINRFDAEEDE